MSIATIKKIVTIGLIGVIVHAIFGTVGLAVLALIVIAKELKVKGES